MANKAKRTEHTGAKRGRGAYWGRKAAAKRESNKARRTADRLVTQGDNAVKKMVFMPYDAADYLRNERDMISFLKACVEEAKDANEPGIVDLAVGAVVRALRARVAAAGQAAVKKKTKKRRKKV